MAISRVASAVTKSSGTPDKAPVFTSPAGSTTGDTLFAVAVYVDGTSPNASPSTLTLPTGWTARGSNLTAGLNTKFRVYFLSTSHDGSSTWTGTIAGSNNCYWITSVQAFRDTFAPTAPAAFQSSVASFAGSTVAMGTGAPVTSGSDWGVFWHAGVVATTPAQTIAENVGTERDETSEGNGTSIFITLATSDSNGTISSSTSSTGTFSTSGTVTNNVSRAAVASLVQFSSGVTVPTGAAVAAAAGKGATVTTGAGGTNASAGNASASATAYAPTLTEDAAPGAGNASASATGQAPLVAVGVPAGAALAGTTAYNLTAALVSSPSAGSSSTAATAFNPTVSSAGQVNAPAGVASASAVAQVPAPSLAASPAIGQAVAAAVAAGPTATLAAHPAAGTASGSAAAYAPGLSLAASVASGWAVGSAGAYSPSALLAAGPLAGVATAGASAFAPAVTVSSNLAAHAGLASVVALAYGIGQAASVTPVGRLFLVPMDHRSWLIEHENRTAYPKDFTRVGTVESETRVYRVPADVRESDA